MTAQSSYSYPTEYSLKPIEEQIELLRNHWPQLDPSPSIHFCREVYPTLKLPPWVEGPFATLRRGFLATNYVSEILTVLRAIQKTRPCELPNIGQEGDFWMMPLYADAIARWSYWQEGDIIILPGQFGLRHKGKSIEEVRNTLQVSEIALGAYDIACMALTHPKRLTCWNQLEVDCAGDEEEEHAFALFLTLEPYTNDIDCHQLMFGWQDTIIPYKFGGAATAFLPSIVDIK